MILSTKQHTLISKLRREISPSDEDGRHLFSEMAPVYSMYREAKNSPSDFYRFLCYYKIMEGLLGKMRGNAHRRARTLGLQLKMRPELVPDNEHLDQRLKAYPGMPIKKFFDDVLMRDFRVAVAHFITADQRVLHAGSAIELYNYGSMSFLCDLCVRVLIQNHEELLAQLN